MTRLGRIREHRDLIERGYAPFPDELLQWYREDIAPLLCTADAALAYEEATQIPDGVQQAEQDLFSTLVPLKEPV
jgi:hypothetical protein